MGGYVLDVIRKPRTPKLELRFRDFGVFVFDRGCFVFEIGCFVFDFWVLRFRDLGVFVFEILGSSFSI